MTDASNEEWEDQFTHFGFGSFVPVLPQQAIPVQSSTLNSKGVSHLEQIGFESSFSLLKRFLPQ